MNLVDDRDMREREQILLRNEEFLTAGGTCTESPWHMWWQDRPYHSRGDRPLSPQSVQSALHIALKEGTPSRRSAVYIHIPFCTLACTYCAFYKKQADTAALKQYAQMLVKEIRSLQGESYVKKSNVEAVFFGGGTPGLLSPEDITAIMDAVKETFPLAKNGEVTMESSLSDMTEEKMDTAIAAGVNRFSFGVQSFDTALRRSIGRPDSREKVLERLAVYTKRKAGIVIDLIYGLPGQTKEVIHQDALDTLSAGIDGLDLYRLQILRGSPLGKAFERDGKTLEQPVLQGLFQEASSVLHQHAELLSCSHWKWNDREKSHYNTLAAEGSDIFAIGMACGGSIGGVGFMKPVNDTAYEKAVQNGYVPFMGMQKSPYARALGVLSGALDQGQIDPMRLEKESSLPVGEMLSILYNKWEDFGLVKRERSGFVYTDAGRYWYKSMARFVMRMAEHIVYGVEEENSNSSAWHGMMNLK